MRLRLSAATALALILAAPSLASANTVLGRVVGEEPVSFTLYLPSRDAAGLQALLAAQQDNTSGDFQRWLTPDEFARRFGPDARIVARAEAALAARGFSVLSRDGQSLSVIGAGRDVERSFGITLDHVVNDAGHAGLAAAAPPVLPSELAALGARIVDFDGFERVRALARPVTTQPDNRSSAVGGYWNTDLRQAYDAPSYASLTGDGRSIAIIIDGDVSDADTAKYFSHEGMAAPSVTRIQVAGGARFTGTTGDSVEASLDVQQSAGIAPKAQIRLYLIPSLSDANILAALRQILQDNKADIVSMSFGACEKLYTAAYNSGHDFTGTLTQYEKLFQQGNAQGITFVAASGDMGGLECPALGYFARQKGTSFTAGASTPATIPEVTAVGGTNLVTSFMAGSTASTYVSENANDDALKPIDPFGLGVTVSGGVWGSGGGPSVVFAEPSWQKLVTTGTTMRATPDIAMHMGGCPGDAAAPCGPNRSYDIAAISGQFYGLIGTSAAAPDFAGTLALLEQKTGKRLGNVNPMIYTNAANTALASAFHRAISGTNGPYAVTAGKGNYSMVLGVGTIDIRLFGGLSSLAAAGNPGTASNP